MRYMKLNAVVCRPYDDIVEGIGLIYKALCSFSPQIRSVVIARASHVSNYI